MIYLKEVDYFEFKDKIYQKYLELFPKDEIMSLKLLKKLYKKEILKFVEIMDEKNVVGFLIYVTLKNNPYVWLDYFAIFKKYQNKNYGTKAINLLKKFLNKYDGIYGEIEKLGFGNTEVENEIRKRRASFWMNLGFEIMDIDLKLFDVIYSPCVLRINDYSKTYREILEYGIILYKSIMSENKYNKNCFVLNE